MDFTNDNYWDCECEGKDYIHHKDFDRCEYCGVHRDSLYVPDSHTSEVLAMGYPIA